MTEQCPVETPASVDRLGEVLQKEGQPVVGLEEGLLVVAELLQEASAEPGRQHTVTERVQNG